MLIPPNKLTTAELNYAVEIPHGWEKEPYRLFALRQLEIIGVMPSCENVIGVVVLYQLIEEEYGGKILYRECIVDNYHAWGLTFFTHGYPVVVLDKVLENPTDANLMILKRTTLAHEFGHIILHREYLENPTYHRSAAYSTSANLHDVIADIAHFKAKGNSKKDVFDYMRPLPHRPWHRWTNEENREFQANQIMVGLLMPCINLRICIVNYLRMRFEQLHEQNGWQPAKALQYRLRPIMEDCANNLAQAFDISKQMAAIEMGRLFHNPHDFPLFLGQMIYPQR